MRNRFYFAVGMPLNYQDNDGSFQSVYMTSYVLQGLALLGAQPLFDPYGFIVRHLKSTLDITKHPSYEPNDALLEPIGTAVPPLPPGGGGG